MLDKIGPAMATSDDKERNNLLQEGEGEGKPQLQVKHQNGPVTQHSCWEASNNYQYVLLTELDEVEHCIKSILHSGRILERASGCWMC